MDEINGMKKPNIPERVLEAVWPEHFWIIFSLSSCTMITHGTEIRSNVLGRGLRSGEGHIRYESERLMLHLIATCQSGWVPGISWAGTFETRMARGFDHCYGCAIYLGLLYY